MKAIILVFFCMVAACFAGLPTGLSKKWFLGGNFTQVNNRVLNNIVQWSSTGIDSVGSGFNGPVHYLTVDLYGTLYAAGAFSKSGSVVTGPVARYVNGAWEPLFANATWSNSSVAYTLTYDCGRFDSIASIKNPTCDVFIGGAFTVTITVGNAAPTTATNLAYFDGSVLSALTTTGAPSSSLTITKLYKKYGVGISASKNYLWVGTSNGLFKYDTSSKQWTSSTTLGFATGKINWIHYKRNIFTTDEIYICGDSGLVVKYDYSKATTTNVGSSALSGTISGCHLGNDDYLYVNGEFTYPTNPTIKNIARIKTTSITTSGWDFVASAVTQTLTGAVTELDICSSYDLGCYGGSYVFVGDKSQAGFYNSNDDSYTKIANITGNAKTAASTFSSASSVKTSFVALAFALVLALFLL